MNTAKIIVLKAKLREARLKRKELLKEINDIKYLIKRYKGRNINKVH
jgi:hypothetical protein